jgi:hypothetical protein
MQSDGAQNSIQTFKRNLGGCVVKTVAAYLCCLTVSMRVVVFFRSVLREEHRLRVSENRLARRVFGPSGDEVTGQ